MKRFASLTLVATALVLLVGCIQSTHVELRQTGEVQEVGLVRHWYGVTVGPCGFAGGAHANYSFQLNGPGPVFPAEQVEFLDEKGKLVEDASKGLTGEVRVDSAHRKVTIDLHRGKYPLEFNGSYKYRER